MALNKEILQKLQSKTKDYVKHKAFILKILEEENKGLGWYKKLYKEEIEKAVLGED